MAASAPLIDSHAHLDARQFERDLPSTVHRASRAGVEAIVTVGVTPSSSRNCLALASRFPTVFATVGFHPHWADGATPDRMDQARVLAQSPEAVAVGEIGLDYRRMRSSKPAQLGLFHDMLGIASEVGRPVVIHDGQAHRDVREAIGAHRKRLNGGVIHCFSGDWSLARVYLDWGFFLSIPGSVTFQRFQMMQEVAAKVPIDRLLLETDAPHLTPAPAPRRRNEPAYVRFVAEEVARLRGIPVEELSSSTTDNTRRVFRLPESNTGARTKVTGADTSSLAPGMS